MPLRPVQILQQNRPNSAIYIGNGGLSTSASSNTSSATSSTLTHIPPSSAPAHLTHNRTSSASSIPQNLPDLPEPPSPVLSNGSIRSGLPSPPTTNSTGSGSTGDSRRHTHASGSRTMLNSTELRKYQQLNTPSRRNGRLSYRYRDATTDHGIDGEFDPEKGLGDEPLDEDNTTRLRLGGPAALGRHTVAAASSENVAALQRVKSLAERNRQALDKLASMARIASPTPSSSSNRHLRTTTMPSKPSVTSPVYSSSSSQTPSSPPSSLSSARSERVRARVSLPPPVIPSTSQEQALSGSETERETTLSLYTGHADNSSPSLPHMTHSLSTISSSSSSSQELNNVYGMSHAHTPSHQSSTTNLPYQTPRQHHHHMSQQLSKTNIHHHISSSASASTPHLPSSAVFQTPLYQVHPLVKTRSTGSTSVTGSTSTSASGSASLNRRLTHASTSSVSGPSHAGNPTDGNAKGKEDSPTSGSSPRRRRGGSGSAFLLQGFTHIRQEREGDGREGSEGDAARTKMRKRREGENDVAQAALAAVTSSKARNSLDMRKRNAPVREFQRDEGGDMVGGDSYVVDPVMPYRNNSASRNHDRDSEWVERQREKRQGIRGGSADSALASRDPTNIGAAGGKSVIDEVLKAVGLSSKKNHKLERGREREKERERRKFLTRSDVFGNVRVDWSPEERVRVTEFGERKTNVKEREGEREKESMLKGLTGMRSATSLSRSSYSSQSRGRTRTGEAGFSDEDDDDGGKREDVMRTAPAGLRAYRHAHLTPRETERERDVVHLSLVKKEKEREMIAGRSMTSLSRYSAFSTPIHQNGSSSSVVSSTLPQQERHNTALYGGRRGSMQVLLNHTGSTTGGDNERAASRQSTLALMDRTEHARLMLESLAMFEGHMARISSSDTSSPIPLHVAELVKTAQSVISSADRLNGLLRAASKNAVEQEIDAEVADDVEAGEGGGSDERGVGMYSARDMVQVWKRVHGDFKEGVKASDDLVRGITGFLLGVGKVLRDMGSTEGGGGHAACMNGVGSGGTHARSISLNDEDIIRSTRGSSPTASGGSGGRSLSGVVGRRSVDINRKGWEPSPSVTAATNAREEALRRLTGRLDGVSAVRSSSLIPSREYVQDTRYESPPVAAHDSAFMTPAPSRSSTLNSRRLPMPREQEQEQRLSRLSRSEDLVGSTSQDTIVPYEPSPTPAPRVWNATDKNKSLPPTPDHNYGSPSETSTSTRGHERRKASNTSISTVRGIPTHPPALNPSGGGATTAVTAHTVSNASPDVAPTSSVSSLISASGSRGNVRSCVTFSKPSTESVPTLAGLQLQYEERQRTSEARVAPISDHAPSTPMSGSETERPPKRQTWGTKTGSKTKENTSPVDEYSRVSLGRAADRSAASLLLSHSGSSRKERKNVAELFPKS